MESWCIAADFPGFRWTLVPSRLGTEAAGYRETLAARKRLNEGPWPVR